MKKILKGLSIVTLLVGITGCDLPFGLGHINLPWEKDTGSADEQNTFAIRYIKNLPDVAPYKDFDVMDVIVPFKDATYSFEGLYLDDRSREKDITFDGSIMNIPQNETVAEITVYATYKGETIQKELLLSVIGVADVMDQGCVDVWCEDSISKKPNYNPQYIKSGDSSVKITFSGYYNSFGVQFCSICGHLSNNDGKGAYDKEYLSIYQVEDQTEAWKDAVICCWVYNDMKEQAAGVDDSIYFGNRIKESTHAGNGVDIDWGNAPIIEAKRGEWTLVYWYLKDLGKTTDFYLDLTQFYNPFTTEAEYRDSYDALTFKVLGKNVAKVGEEYNRDIKYTFTFYFDSYDILTASQFEDKYQEYIK